MPTILTPKPLDFKPGHDDLHAPNDGDNGSGRRPPTDKLTGGSGDGENWEDQPQGSRGPRERISRARVGILLTLFVIAMLFVGLAAVFLVTKAQVTLDSHHHQVRMWRAAAVPGILWLNTVFLMLSSVSAEFARRGMFREHELMEEWLGIGHPISRRATIWLSVTLAFGLAFLAGQCKAWTELHSQLPYVRNSPGSTFFYLLTISHAAHLLAGIGALLGAIVVLQRSRSLGTRQVVVDTTTWYWHAMGLLWLFLFALLEYGQ